MHTFLLYYVYRSGGCPKAVLYSLKTAMKQQTAILSFNKIRMIFALELVIRETNL